MSLLKKRPIKSTNNSANSAANNAAMGHSSASSGSITGSMTKVRSLQSSLTERWQALPPRDRLALSVLMLFLLLFIGGYGGYVLHSLAQQSKADYNEQIEDYFWLRAQAGNINTDYNEGQNTQANEPPATQVTSQLNQAGISNPQVVATGESVQMSFESISQAIVGKAISNLQQQGWQFSRLNVQQNPTNKQIMVQAVVSR